MEPKLSRRQALQLGALSVAGTAALAGTASQANGQETQAQSKKTPRPPIKPRSAWATNHPVKGTLKAEEDVRFLLVHHSASRNDYSADETAKQIQSFYNFHTSSEKGWPDVAYNFFVDRFGTIWEAREGSLKGAVRGDATGGSQGYAMLCCFIGNHQEIPISSEAKNSMIQLLAWLADTYAIETDPGATVAFTSRGSNKWEQGQSVTARTISAHREMSLTSCPGDFAFSTIRNELPEAVTKVRNSYAPAPSTTLSSPSSTVEVDSTSIAPASTTITEASQSTIETERTALATATTADPPRSVENSANTVTQNSENRSNVGLYSAFLLASGGAAAAVAAALVIRKKRTDGMY